MPGIVTSLPPEPFARALAELEAMHWLPRLKVDKIGSPQRIAPYSVAISAELMGEIDSLSSGRLILLHDPTGNEAWEGTFRLVTYVRSDMDLDMVADPLLPDVAWTWFTDALDGHGCRAHALAGTVTASYGRGFGTMDHTERADVELRCSWTPILDERNAFAPHLAAWQELLGQVAGQPPLPAGVTLLAGRR